MTQWLVEESVFEAVDLVDRFQRARSAGPPGFGGDPLAGAGVPVGPYQSGGGAVLSPHEANKQRVADAVAAAKAQAV